MLLKSEINIISPQLGNWAKWIPIQVCHWINISVQLSKVIFLYMIVSLNTCPCTVFALIYPQLLTGRKTPSYLLTLYNAARWLSYMIVSYDCVIEINVPVQCSKVTFQHDCVIVINDPQVQFSKVTILYGVIEIHVSVLCPMKQDDFPIWLRHWHTHPCTMQQGDFLYDGVIEINVPVQCSKVTFYMIVSLK